MLKEIADKGKELIKYQTLCFFHFISFHYHNLVKKKQHTHIDIILCFASNKNLQRFNELIKCQSWDLNLNCWLQIPDLLPHRSALKKTVVWWWGTTYTLKSTGDKCQLNIIKCLIPMTKTLTQFYKQGQMLLSKALTGTLMKWKWLQEACCFY